MMNTGELIDFHSRQLAVWPMAAANFAALQAIEVKEFEIDGLPWRVQHNPARIASTAAKLDKYSLAARPCFLCDANRPDVQLDLPVEGGGYKVLVNPFPIFPVHFTIPAVIHTPQLITAGGARRFADMFRMARSLSGMALFYNGPACGASAPDHFHFQAVERTSLPIFDWVERNAALPFKVAAADLSDEEGAREWFRGVCDTLSRLPENIGLEEPRINILCAAVAGGVRAIVIPRRAHRPDFYGTASGQLLLSPASVDLSGVVIAPSSADFHHKINSSVLRALLSQTCYTVG